MTGSDAPPRPLLSVHDLRVTFDTAHGALRAVDRMSFAIAGGEVLAIVGESGSGKSVTARSIMGLLPPSARAEGEVRWKGRDLLSVGERALRAVRGREIAMIPQDPMSSLNPVHTVGNQIAEVLRIHTGATRRQARARAVETLALVGIPNPRTRSASYPHEFSGGMRQRVLIAMALAAEPDLLIADEPTTALDVTIQAQVLDVLADVRERTGSALLLITHDLGLVAGVADRVLVMYGGSPVEHGSARAVFLGARHPYTSGLLAALPRADQPRNERLRPIAGHPPSPARLPPGCSFSPRCPRADPTAGCLDVIPVLVTAASGHGAACHLVSPAQASADG